MEYQQQQSLWWRWCWFNLCLLLFVIASLWNPVNCIFPSRHNKETKAETYLDETRQSEGREDGVAHPKKNFWELISSSSDVVPVKNRSISDEVILPSRLSIATRLQKLEFDFNILKIHEEDCRQRLLCEMAENPSKFSPLSTALLEETSYKGDDKMLAASLLATKDGARLLSYIEATQKGLTRSGCNIWTYRCPQTATSMIDYKALLVWRELSKWLTVQYVAKRS